MRRDKDYSEREHRADHLLLVFERYLVFLEKGSGSGSGSSLLASERDRDAGGLPTVHLRALPVIDLSAATAPPPSARAGASAKEARAPSTGETKRLTIQLCPIVELAGVLKVTADARGECIALRASTSTHL